MANELDSDRSYDPLERQIFQMAKQASKEADRLRDSASNVSASNRTIERRGRTTITNGGTLGRSTRPRSVGAFNRRGNGHLSGSEGTRFSSGPDADSEYNNRSDTEKMQHRTRANQVEYVSGMAVLYLFFVALIMRKRDKKITSRFEIKRRRLFCINPTKK